MKPKGIRLNEDQSRRSKTYADTKNISHAAAIVQLMERGLDVGDDEVQSLAQSLSNLSVSMQEMRDRFAAVEANFASMPELQAALEDVLSTAQADEAHRFLFVQTLCELLVITRWLLSETQPDNFKRLEAVVKKQVALFTEEAAATARQKAGIKAIQSPKESKK